MDETCCPMFAYIDAVTFPIMDNSWDQTLSDFAYCQMFECESSPGGYCEIVGL